MLVDLEISVVKLQAWEEVLVYLLHKVLPCLLQIWNQTSLVINLVVGYVVKVLVRNEVMPLEKYQEKEIYHQLFQYCYHGMGIQELLTTFVLEQQLMVVKCQF